ncbi:hypothetical protein UlMin_019094 [Ulmus minor]
MENLEEVDTKSESCFDDSMHLSDDFIRSENLGVDLLADLDSYLQDINDRLTISRMVSDSVIKGMVTAVEQGAADKIAQKELELSGLKERLHLYHVGVDENETRGSLAVQSESKGTKDRKCCGFFEAVAEHRRMKETLGSLRNASKEQFIKLRGCSSELLGFGGILEEKSSERWIDVDGMLDCLKTTLETAYQGMEEIVHSSEASLFAWQQEHDFRSEIEALVMGNCIRGLEQEFEAKSLNRICGDENINWLGRIKEISDLREQLIAVSKCLNVSEVGPLNSHGSLDGEGWSNKKKSDHFHRKVLSNRVAASPCEENGKHEELQTDNLEILAPAKLKHMNKDELIVYYNNELTKMKRNHEAEVQEKTEEYFRLRGAYLREKDPMLSKKDTEFDVLRKKIPEVVLKLDDILAGNEKLPTVSNNEDSLSSLKDRIETLLVENSQLRDSLTDKKKEVKCLESQVSAAAERMSRHSLSEARLLNTIRHLKYAIQDLHIENSIGEDIFTCLLREMMGQIKCIVQESYVEYNVMQEFYDSLIKETSHNAESTSQCEVEDSDMLSIIVQGLFEVLFRESWKEAEEKLNILSKKYNYENEIRVSLEKELLEKEKTLEMQVGEKERLKEEIIFLVEEKEKLAEDSAAALKSEKESYELAFAELKNLRIQTCQQRKLISERSKESDVIKGDLAVAQKEIELYIMCIKKLKREVDEERRTLLAVIQEKQNALSSSEANESEVRKQMESMVLHIQGLTKAAADFECRVTEDVSKKCSRLKNLSSRSRLLIQKANLLKGTASLYKQRLDRRCSDLQKAEDEVDLLGDEVDALLSLLEKIYIALDHYSPILQHYPGIIEILKLVRRELSGESTRPLAR